MTAEIISYSVCGAMLLYDLLHIPAVEVGNILGDYLRKFRLENLENINQQHQEQMKARGLRHEDARYIEPKFGLPLLDAASLDTDEILQKVWSVLLTNAADFNFKSEIKTAFIDVIKTLTPVEVKILEYCNALMSQVKDDEMTEFIFYLDREKIIKAMNISAISFEAAIQNLERCRILTETMDRWFDVSENGKDPLMRKCLTSFGILFIRACISDFSFGDVEIVS